MAGTSVHESDASDELREAWESLDADERLARFRQLPRDLAGEFLLTLSHSDQASVILRLPKGEQKLWLRMLAPDDVADILQGVDVDLRQELLPLLDESTRREVNGLLAYEEDEAGGLMNPRFARVRVDATVDEAITYLRRQSRANLETIYYCYVLDNQQHLVGVASFRDLFSVPGDRRIADVMSTDLITVPEDMDQEAVARVMATHDVMAIPVVDADGHMKGIVTVDDIVDVVQEEATEDIQKMGGMEALDVSYLQTSFFTLLKKRAGWLAVLFLGEMLTASAMSHFEDELAASVVLALFIPLIISSGGNAGSQATTLIIRAMALGEIRLRDWYRVVRRELMSGLALGAFLAVIGFVRIIAWERMFHAYGPHAHLIATTVALSVIGVVTWGTLAGSMLPLLLRRLGADPASASAPFVATLVDVSGLVIYFTFAKVILSGSLLHG